MLLTTYIDDVIAQWRTHKPTTKLSFLIDPAVALEATILADRTLTHALINILNNAAEASSDAGQGIEFKASWTLSQLNIAISDHGPGFPQDLVKVVGTQPVASAKKGLGVGLFLAYSTINRLGGVIEISNPDEGGACVSIALPLLSYVKTEVENDA